MLQAASTGIFVSVVHLLHADVSTLEYVQDKKANMLHVNIVTCNFGKQHCDACTNANVLTVFYAD